jgi:hypothetical protein
MANKRVVIVANKWYECDPLLIAALLPTENGPQLPWPTFPSFPHRHYNDQNRPSSVQSLPRLVFQFDGGAVEVWCISDLIEDQPTAYQSSSEKKADRLGMIFQRDPFSLKVAFGTAGYPSHDVHNGSVVIGTSAFLRDGHPAGPNATK